MNTKLTHAVKLRICEVNAHGEATLVVKLAIQALSAKLAYPAELVKSKQDPES